MGREQTLTIAYMWIYLLLTLIVHLAHFLVVILISWENYSDVWQTDLRLGRLTDTLLCMFCPRPTKALRLTALDCMNYKKRWGFPLLWCCMDSPSSHAPLFIASASSVKLRCVYRFVYKVCCVNSWALEGRSTWALLCLGFRAHAQ